MTSYYADVSQDNAMTQLKVTHKLIDKFEAVIQLYTYNPSSIHLFKLFQYLQLCYGTMMGRNRSPHHPLTHALKGCSGR